jgi:hypothetical protein
MMGAKWDGSAPRDKRVVVANHELEVRARRMRQAKTYSRSQCLAMEPTECSSPQTGHEPQRLRIAHRLAGQEFCDARDSPSSNHETPHR